MVFEALFKAKRVLVTGAAKGIGRAVAVRLNGYGAKVFGLDKDASLKDLVKECPQVSPVSVDLADWNATRAAVKAVGPVDGLVNNAALLRSDVFLSMTPEDFNAQMDVNVRAVVNVSQVVAQAMIDNGVKGSIVNISSLATDRVLPVTFSHALTKASLELLTKLMANELGPKGIRVNTVAPASVMTELFNVWLVALSQHFGQPLEQLSAGMVSQIPLGRPVAEMDEVVNTILFALSDLSSMTTGSRYVIDGGFAAS